MLKPNFSLSDAPSRIDVLEQSMNNFLVSDPVRDTPPALGGIKPIKPVDIKGAFPLQSDVLPLDSPYAQDIPVKMDCEKKWEDFAMTARFGSEEAMLQAKKEFLAKCKGLGTSIVSEPTKELFPDLLPPSGGGGSASSDEVTEEMPIKKRFPYWLIAVAVVGGYLIFRKK